MKALDFLLRTRGRRRLHWTDVLSYAYLLVGLFTLFAPVLWLVLSSFKTEAAIGQFPPTLLPYSQKVVQVAGHAQPLPLYRVTTPSGESREMAQVSRIGIQATMVDPARPEDTLKVNIRQRQPVQELGFAWRNYTDLFGKFTFGTYLWNSVFITVVATLLTLLFNSMAAFALSKYRFTGQKAVYLLIIATLMIPPTIILVPVFLVINQVGLLNNLWGVILPAVATPTGVFLLRQYMLTIPDELIEAARMDHASEWRIYWRIVLPLSAPALAVLAIFSVMWRWNDFLLPLIVLSRNEQFTLQLALNAFQGELNTQWHYLLAMTVITLLPVTLVFAFLQRHITTGIASAGVK
ncbi:carbohydrate ABC transporter permease [Leptothrix discophora]|uniref:Carbohydrate ABC transporter permease n=1 Tax=Leptothrix discophora TaxID=89 RepID=A0ABT9FYQ4_LEPDI|nr:carbohydrate ABC transporter permease [Leptothrix discophora]MDP4299280.1 carbohydrate ABC transporter permease [Leptothrix discophora]